MKYRKHNGQKFDETKGVIRRHKSMKNREHNGQSLKGRDFNVHSLCMTVIVVDLINLRSGPLKLRSVPFNLRSGSSIYDNEVKFC